MIYVRVNNIVPYVIVLMVAYKLPRRELGMTLFIASPSHQPCLQMLVKGRLTFADAVNCSGYVCLFLTVGMLYIDS